jgi:apurinic endonuclease APN1
MGFVLIGAGSLSDLGLSGAMLQMISHGLIGAALFFLAGTSYDRSRTLLLDEFILKMEEFRIIYNKFSEEQKKRLRICIDTAHLFASGYDLSNPTKVNEFIKTFDTLIGWKYVDLIHLNDSKTKLNSHLDRHELLDEGNIKLKGLSVIIKFAYKANIPLILETPGGYPIEINIIRKILKI